MKAQIETAVRDDIISISEDDALKYASKTLRNLIIQKDNRIKALKAELTEARNRYQEQKAIIKVFQNENDSAALLKRQDDNIVNQQDVIKDLKDYNNHLQKQLKDLQKRYDEREVAIKEIIANKEAKQCLEPSISVGEELRGNKGKDLQKQLRDLKIKLERAETIKIEQAEIINQLNWKINQLTSEDYDTAFQPEIYRKRTQKDNRIYLTSFESVFLQGDIDLLLLTPEHITVLKDANIHTVYDLVTAPKRKLLSLDNITSSTLFKFNGRLKSRNLHIGLNIEYDEAKGVYVEVVKEK